MKHLVSQLKIIALLPFCLSSAFASNEMHEAHVHGVSDLTIAVDKNLIEINFTSPTINLMGFEGRAQNKEQLKTVEQTRKKLTQYGKLFSFSGTGCVMAKSALNLPDLSPEEPSHHHHSHHGHGHEHSHEHMIERQHTNVTAMYQYRCQDNEKLSGINVNLFDLFPATEQVKTQWINKDKQGAATLTKKNKMVQF